MSITIFFFSVCIYLCFRYRKDTTFFRMKKEKGAKCNFTSLVKGKERVGIRKIRKPGGLPYFIMV